MSRIIYCLKLNKEAEGLERPPYSSPIGQKIFEHISKEAWSLWLKHQTLLINENRLNVLEANARSLLMAEMEKFLFGQGSETPAGFTPSS
ncbi:MAG: putative Fe(2+)-trafficking protein [Francisellaceae bacterium]|nr:putative Fe(2+)-trafficking protein [Francisellaceae bacterium]